MRAAILGDIHGNSLALDAVLADIESQGGVEAYWLLGDYAAIGHDPVGCLERVSQLPNAKPIRGNTDRQLGEDLAIGEDFKGVMAKREAALKSAQLHVSFAWTHGALHYAGWLDWLTKLPLDYRAELPDGTQLLLVHASPGSDTGDGLHPYCDDAELEERFGSDKADLIIVGHTHVAVDREFQGKRLINASSVSNPFPPDLDANYLILEADDEGYSIERHRVPYDRKAVIRLVNERQHPGRDYIIGFMRGENRAGWMR